MSLLEVYVYSGPADGFSTLLGIVPDWTSLSAAPLGSNQGAGSISIPLQSPLFTQPNGTGGTYTPETTPVLNEETLWQVRMNGTAICEFLAQSVDRSTVSPDGTATVTISGPDTSQVLNWAMVMPTGWTPTGPSVLTTGSIDDQFDIPSPSGGFEVDFSLWNLSNQAACTIPSSGTLQVATGQQGAFLAGGPFSIANSSISASITPVALTGSGTYDNSGVTEMIVHAAGGRQDGYAMFGLSFLNFYAQYQDPHGNVQTWILGPGTTGGTGAYAQSWAQYWRISCDILAGGQQQWKWWTSGDGSTWTLKHSYKPPVAWFSGGSGTQVNIYFGGNYDLNGVAAMQVTALNGEVQYSPSQGPIYVNTPAMSAYISLLQAAQARGTVAYVAPTFTAAADSSSGSWTDKWSLQVPIGTDLLSLLQNYAGAIGADWRMRPGFLLDIGQQGSLGTDRHNSVVFHTGEVTELGRTNTRDQVYNVIAAADGAGAIHTAISGSSVTNWGQRELWVASGGTIDAVSASQTALAALDQLDTEVVARVMQIAPDQPGKTVFTDFGIFDWIGIERSDNSATDSLRVVGITVSADQDGAETHEVILQTYRQFVVQWLQYLINKFGGQSAATLGTIPGGINANGLPVGVLGSLTAGPAQAGGAGSSGTGLVTATSLAATPEVSSGQQVIPGTMIISGTLPQSAFSFTLPTGAKVTFSSSAPANPATGDLWYNTANGMLVSQWDGTEWAPYQLGAAAVSFTATQIGGITTYVQGSAPAGDIANGSLWFNTSAGMQMFQFESPGWEPYQWGTGAIAAGAITAAQIAAGTITASQIAAGTITAQQISANTITAAQIAGGTITATELAAGAVTAAQIAAGAIDGTTINGATLNAVQIFGDTIVVSGANNGVFAYGTPASQVSVYTTTGAHTYAAPASGSVNVYTIGGAGGGGDSTGNGGGGGGGGGIGILPSYSVSAGNYYLSVGTGGAAGHPGGNGGDTWFNTSNTETGALVYGHGGNAGHADGSLGGGAGGGFGGTGSGVTGYNGGSGGSSSQNGGGAGGGGAAGAGGAGGNGGTATGRYGTGGGAGGTGGTPGYTGGAGGRGGDLNNPGSYGISPGGGGGGAGGNSGGGGGGAGGRAYVVFTASGGSALVTSLTGLAGSDPVNNAAVPAGVMTSLLTLTPSTAPTAVSDDALAFADSNGRLAYVNGTTGDLQTYYCGRQCNRLTSGLLINTTSPATTITSVTLAAGVPYILEGLIAFTGGQNAGTAVFGYDGSASTSTLVGWAYMEGGTVQQWGYSTPSSLNTPTSATLSTSGVYTFQYKFLVILSSAGNWTITGKEGTSSDTWTCGAGSFMTATPVA